MNFFINILNYVLQWTASSRKRWNFVREKFSDHQYSWIVIFSEESNEATPFSLSMLTLSSLSICQLHWTDRPGIKSYQTYWKLSGRTQSSTLNHPGTLSNNLSLRDGWIAFPTSPLFGQITFWLSPISIPSNSIIKNQTFWSSPMRKTFFPWKSLHNPLKWNVRVHILAAPLRFNNEQHPFWSGTLHLNLIFSPDSIENWWKQKWRSETTDEGKDGD
jgi:hypothetical protein